MLPLKFAAMLSILAAACATSAFAASTTYTIDPNHSFAHFSYNHMGFSTQQSRFNKVSGTVSFDPAQKSGSADVDIDIRSVDTGSALTQHLMAADFFDTAHYPTATFKSTAVKFSGGQPVSLEGDLTIKGITKPVTLTVTHFHYGQSRGKQEAIGGDAVTQVKRSEFNLGEGVPMVGDEVTVTVDFEAKAGP